MRFDHCHFFLLLSPNATGERRGPPRRSQPDGSTPHRIRQPPPTRRKPLRNATHPRALHSDQEISRWHSWSPKLRLLGSLPDQLKCPTGRRRRVDELQFIRREGGDKSLLIGPDQVRERTSLKLH